MYRVTLRFNMPAGNRTHGTSNCFDYCKALARAWVNSIGGNGDSLGVCVDDLEQTGEADNPPKGYRDQVYPAGITEEHAREIGALVISELLLNPRAGRVRCLNGDKTPTGLGLTIARIVCDPDGWKTA